MTSVKGIYLFKVMQVPLHDIQKIQQGSETNKCRR